MGVIYSYDGQNDELRPMASHVLGDITVIETWQSDDGTSWYRKWSDGWIEQGGRVTSSSAQTLPTPFTTNTYTVVVGAQGTSGNANVTTRTKTTIALMLLGVDGANYTSYGIIWYACGY